MGLRKLLLGSLALTSIVSVADRAAAQEADGGTAFGDIVVTAQKRDENLQDVPLSVTAFTAEMREETGIITTQDQLNFTPGVTYSATADRVSIRGIGRTTNVVGTDPGVAIYNDGFYQPSVLDVGGSTLGVERVEVLRGPQGTLYGRNSIGGAINVISRRPSDEFEGEFRGGLNHYGRTTFEGRVSGPLGEGVAASLQFQKINQEEGYFDNLFPGMPDEGGVTDSWAINAQLAWEVNERFDIWARLVTAGADNRGRASNLVSQWDYGYSLENVPTPSWDRGPVTAVNPNGLNLSNPGIQNPREFNTDRESTSALTDYWLFITEATLRMDAFDIRYIGGYQQSEANSIGDADFGPSYGFDWPLSDNWALNALSYLGAGDLAPGDNSGATVPLSGDVTAGLMESSTNRWSHEINISSSHDGPLQWLFGLYYYQEAELQDFFINFPTESIFDTVYSQYVSPVNLALAVAGLIPGVSATPLQFLTVTYLTETDPGSPDLAAILLDIYGAPVPVLSGVANPNRDGYRQLGELETRSSAIFAQFDYDFSDTLHGTFGLRYSHDEKDGIEAVRFPTYYPFFYTDSTPIDVDNNGVPDGTVADNCAVDPPGGEECNGATGTIISYVADASNPGTRFSREDSWNHATGTVGLQWTPTDDTLLYASYSHGYKSGGFNLGTRKPPVDAESVDAVEIGWKQTFGSQFQLNAALFHYAYDGLQVSIQIPAGPGQATPGLVNIEESTLYGVELEGMWAPTDNLRIMANYSWLDTEILGDGTSADCNGPPTADPANCFLDNARPFAGTGFGVNVTGNQLPLSPEHKFALNATYLLNFEPGTLALSLTQNVRSESYYTIFNTPDYFMEGFETTDIRASWTDSENRYSLIAGVSNLFDEEAVTSFDTTSPQTSNQQTVGLQPPRIAYAEFQLRF